MNLSEYVDEYPTDEYEDDDYISEVGAIDMSGKTEEKTESPGDTIASVTENYEVLYRKIPEHAKIRIDVENGNVYHKKTPDIYASNNHEIVSREINTSDIDQDIKTKALEILNKMDLSIVGVKGNNKNLCKFACIYYAHEELDQPTDPKYLAEKLKVNPAKCRDALNKFSELQTGYCPAKREANASQLIPELMEKLGIRNGFIDAQRFSDKILKKNPDLKEISPQNLSAAILLHYLIIHGFDINLVTYPSIVEKKKATIDSIYRKVVAADS